MNKKVLLEIVWWLATAIIVVLFLLPIYTAVGDEYPFYITNTFFIVLFITFTRYIFLLKHTFLANKKWWKVAFVFIPIPIFFYASDALYDFQDYLDADNYIRILDHLHPDKAMEIFKYIKYQFTFFATGGMIVLFLLPVRMVVSVWRMLNRGTV